MPDSIGPHLLGRRPSTPDPRDYPLRLWLNDQPTPLEVALKTLLSSHAARSTKTWAQIATPLILSAAPTPVPVPPGPPAPTPTSFVWDNNEPVLDQGNFGTCVGNGCAQWGNTLPIDDRFDEVDARALYYEATIIDGQPDNPDIPDGGQQGSTVRSGVTALRNRGRLNAYAFAASVNEAVAWVLAHGPVIVGSDWTEGMFQPDANGYVKPSGAVAGGHCFLLLGCDSTAQELTFLNSWSASWGVNGRFKMLKTDFESLFANQGEACAAVELPLVSVVGP